MLNSILHPRRDNRTNQRGEAPPITNTQLIPTLRRRNSDITLNTLVDDSTTNNSDLISLITNESEETVLNDDIRIFQCPISTYTKRLELPVVSNFLSPGVMVFASNESLSAYQKEMNHKETVKSDGGIEPTTLAQPILYTSTSVWSIFKKNSPFMEIHQNISGIRHEFCKVYFRILATNLTCYILNFKFEGSGLTKTVILLNNNSCRPSVDFIYQGSKVRITGITGATSTFGTGFIKSFILDDDTPHLAHDLDINIKGGKSDPIKEENLIKNMKISTSSGNQLANLLIGGKSNSVIFRNMMNGKNLINTPFATYLDNGDKRIMGTKLNRHGTIGCFESPESSKPISENSLVITCIILVLREQEYRKNKGNNKPTFVSNPTLHPGSNIS
ncbi:hypothetical protein CAAN1_01S12596 [[Candida] anglica]|uniref:Uncharacterized protein n=1 Tax=[Candida] anglica TaxID=148631 RepID=A0ABP0EM62_9ASCO